MELALEKRQVKCCKSLLRQRLRCEAMQEMIVPDALEDIAVMAGASGDVMTDSRTLARGRLSVGGRVAVRAMYAGEGGALRSLALWIPFRADWENARLTEGCSVRLRPWLEALTVRELNSRKILVRVNVCIDAEIFESVSAEICVGAGEAEGLFVKTGKTELESVLSLDEREVSVSDRLELPAAKPPARELLRVKTELVTGESKAVGGKVIFKGGARIAVCYISEAGRPESAGFELPFSQIIDCSAEDAAACVVTMFLSELEAELSPDREGRSIDVTLGVTLQALCAGREELICLEDMFSSRGDVACQRRELEIECLGRREKAVQNVRELVETGAADAVPADVMVALSPPSAAEGEVFCDAEITVIFTDAAGAAMSAKRTARVAAPMDMPPEAVITASLIGETAASPGPGGILTAFQVEFSGECRETRRLSAVTAAELSDIPGGRSAPGAVLRRAEGETLWDICREYRADPALAAALNGVPEGEPLGDVFLLIPVEL